MGMKKPFQVRHFSVPRCSKRQQTQGLPFFSLPPKHRGPHLRLGQRVLDHQRTILGYLSNFPGHMQGSASTWPSVTARP